MQSLQPNSTLQGGKYKIISVLGQGGFGITYLAEQVMLGRKVAIKEFFMKELCNRDEETSQVSVGSAGSIDMVDRFKEKFLKEARLIAGMDNNHIVRIFDIFEENSTAYYIMENIDGGSVDGLVKNGALKEADVLKIIKEVGSALEYIHNQNVLHLDVKPSNILLRKNGEAVLIDFGISKRYDSEGGQTSTTPIGISKGYAPIEQYNQGLQNFSPATDVYSLGATLYKLLTGQTPPEAPMLLDEEELPDCPSNVSPKIWESIEKAMEPRKKKRYQSVGEFLANIENDGMYIQDSTKTITQHVEEVKVTQEEVKVIPSTPDPSHIEEEATIMNVKHINNNGWPVVDLGLSVKWAKFNIGAKSEYDKGHLYPFVENDLNQNVPTSICGDEELDTCRKKLGGSWRLPRNSELTELRTKCKWEYDSKHSCYKVIGPNGDHIILPTTHTRIGMGSSLYPYGRYWSGELHAFNQSTAYYMFFDCIPEELTWRNGPLDITCALRAVID